MLNLGIGGIFVLLIAMQNKLNVMRKFRFSLYTLSLFLTLLFTQGSIEAQTIDLELQMESDVTFVTQGDTFTLSLVLSNNGPSDAEAQEVALYLPEMVTYVSATSGVYDVVNHLLQFSESNLAAGESRQTDVTLTADAEGSLELYAEVISAIEDDIDSVPNNDDGNQDEDDEAVVGVQVESWGTAIDLELDVTISATTIAVGDQVTYTFELTNQGPDAAYGVNVAHTIPEGLTFVSSETSTGQYVVMNDIWNAGEMMVGATEYLSITVVATVDDSPQITAEVESWSENENIQDIDSTPNNDDGDQSEDDECGTVFFVESGNEDGTVDLLLMTIPEHITAVSGEPFQYKILLTNGGPEAATGVSVETFVPAGSILQSSEGNFSPGTGIWYHGDLGVGEVAELVVNAVAGDVGAHVVESQVHTCDQTDVNSSPANHIFGTPSSENDERLVTMVVQPAGSYADLEVDFNIDYQTGEQFASYNIVVSNEGTIDATGIVVDLDIPNIENLIYETANSPGATLSGDSWSIESLAAGASIACEIQAQMESGLNTYIVKVSACETPDLDSSPEWYSFGFEDDEVVITEEFETVEYVIDLEVEFVVSDMQPEEGEEFGFELIVTNLGPDDATSVQVRSDLSTDLQYVMGDFEFEMNEYILYKDIALLAAGETRALGGTMMVYGMALGALPWSFQVTEAGQNDIDSEPHNDDGDQSEDDEAGVLLQVGGGGPPAGVIDLELSMEAHSGDDYAGDNTYSALTLYNNSLTDATGVQVYYPVDPGYAFVSSDEWDYDPVTGIWDVGEIQAGGYRFLERIQMPYDGGIFYFEAQVIAADQQDVDSTPNNDDGQHIEDDEAGAEVWVNALNDTPIVDLALEITAVPESYLLDEQFEVVLEITNEYMHDADAVEVSIALPEGLAFIGAIASEGLFASAESVWNVGEVKRNEPETLTLTLGAAEAGDHQILAEIIKYSDVDGAADFDSEPNNDDGDQSEDDEAGITITVAGPACTEEVWPGDANNDGIANNFDLLNLGLVYGTSGPARAETSTEWQGFEADCWEGYFDDEVNYNHADCDGDGQVTMSDQLAITENYGLTHGKTEDAMEATEDDPQLFLEEPADILSSGMFLDLPVRLGTESIPASNTYGLAFTVSFENIEFVPGTFFVDFGDSWVGEEGVNLLTFEYLLQSSYEVDIAITRNDQSDQTGFGPVCAIHGMIDDIAGKKNSEYKFSIKNVRAITSKNEPQPIFVEEPTNNEGTILPGKQISFYPNPASSMIYLDTAGGGYDSYQLFDITGKLVKQGGLSISSTEIWVEDLIQGTYLLKVLGSEHSSTRQITIIK